MMYRIVFDFLCLLILIAYYVNQVEANKECKDNSVFGRGSDCPNRESLCKVPAYQKLMFDECPKTCKVEAVCGSQKKRKPKNVVKKKPNNVTKQGGKSNKNGKPQTPTKVKGQDMKDIKQQTIDNDTGNKNTDEKMVDGDTNNNSTVKVPLTNPLNTVKPTI